MDNVKNPTVEEVSVRGEQIVAEITIIVPVYNVEKYIRRCMDSLLAQTFENIEILLIDDGSKDSSGTICDEYALKDDRVKVFHKKNGGVSSARNVGLDNATGTYIMFCDPDDYVDPAWCEKLYNSIVNGGLYSACGYSIVSSENGVVLRENAPNFSATSNMPLNSEYLLFLYNHGLFRMVWNAIFKNSIIKTHNLRFREEYSRAEDTLFAVEYLKTQEGNINYVEKSLYLYVSGITNSLTRKIPNNYIDGELCWLKRIHSLMFEYNIDKNKYVEKYNSQITYAILTSINGVLLGKDSLISKLQRIHTILDKDECREVLINRELSEVSTVYAKVLYTRNSFLIWLFNQAAKIKQRIIREPLNNAALSCSRWIYRLIFELV